MKQLSSNKFKILNKFNRKAKNKINEININHTTFLIKPKATLKKIMEKKEEMIYYDKSQKEILLNIIKNTQLHFLNQLNDANNNEKSKGNKKDIKTILENLKLFVAYLLNEKIKNKDYLQLDVNNKKSKLLAEISKYLKYEYDFQNTNKNKNKTRLYLDIDKEEREKKNLFSELFNYKLKNFITENEIKEAEFKLMNSIRQLNFIKKTFLFPEENKEIFFYNNFERTDLNNEINYIIQEKKDKYLKSINKLKKIKEEQELYLNAINKIKANIVIKNNIVEQDIIQELSFENKITNNS